MKNIIAKNILSRSFRGAAAMALAAFAVVHGMAGAAQNDFFPTDFVALEESSLNISTYALQQRLHGSVYVNGVGQFQGDVTTNMSAIRISRSFALGEQSQYAIAPVMVLTNADAETTGTIKNIVGTRASGNGDLRLGTAFWFHIDRDNREYALLSAFVNLPTGDYDASQILNIGENRVKTIVALGWMKTLSDRWVLEMSPEVAFFGDNDRYHYVTSKRLSQDTAYALTGSLRYKLTPAWHWYLSTQVNGGGATQLNGSHYKDAPENTRVAVGTLLLVDERNQIQLRYAQDTAIHSGFRNDGELALRWSIYFK